MVEPLGDWRFKVLKTRLLRPSLNAAIRALIFERDGYVCSYCGTEDGPFDVDHIHPVARGGSDDPENLCVACAPCNRSKGARTLSEWRQ
jgi:5-methylcytosine-specific restriction endonuclease McrA